MKELRLKYPVPMMRRIMNVSASGYYAWVDRPLSKRAQEEVRLELEIRAAHQRTRQTYGPERLQRDLAEHGVRVGVCRIKRIRQEYRNLMERSGLRSSMSGNGNCFDNAPMESFWGTLKQELVRACSHKAT